MCSQGDNFQDLSQGGLPIKLWRAAPIACVWSSVDHPQTASRLGFQNLPKCLHHVASDTRCGLQMLADATGHCCMTWLGNSRMLHTLLLQSTSCVLGQAES